MGAQGNLFLRQWLMADTYLRLYANSGSLRPPQSKMVQYAGCKLPQFGGDRAIVGKQHQFASAGCDHGCGPSQCWWKDLDERGLQCELLSDFAVQALKLRQFVEQLPDSLRGHFDPGHGN